MTDRCWEELRHAGKALAENPGARRQIVNTAAAYFELPRSPEAEAVRVFLDGLCGALEDEEELDLTPPLSEAAQ
jgi:hypothetical protein